MTQDITMLPASSRAQNFPLPELRFSLDRMVMRTLSVPETYPSDV
jgi:hypothetical protein